MGKFRLPTDPDSTRTLRMLLGQSEFLQVGGGEVTLKGGKGGGWGWMGVDKGEVSVYRSRKGGGGVCSKYDDVEERGSGTHHQLNIMDAV